MADRTTIFGNNVNADGVYVIRNEDDAWNLLEKLQNDDFEIPDDIAFDGWGTFQLYLNGEKWNSSLSPSIFPVFQQLQKNIHRLYAEVQYNGQTSKLTNEDKDNLEIIIQVSPGSSDTKTKLDYTELAKACLKKMDGKQVLCGIIACGLMYSGVTVYKSHLQTQRDIRIEESQSKKTEEILQAVQFMSAQETQRMHLMERALRGNELEGLLYSSSSDLYSEMIKSATKAEESTISGVSMNADIAKELSKSKNPKPQPIQINGHFKVLRVDQSNKPLTEITLKEVGGDERVVKAKFDLIWFNDEDKEIIKNVEWDESGEKFIKANINARISEKDGHVVSADLVKVYPLEEGIKVTENK